MYAFDYRRPSTLSDAELNLNALSGAKLLAGGQTIIPAIKLRLNRPEVVIDLGGIAGLNDIARKGAALAIGAMATHAQIAESPAVAASIAGLGRLAEGIGDPQVRNRGTIGGSLANNDPASDYPAAVLALNATLATTKRTIAADDFFRGLFATALADNEILTEIAFPIPKRFAYAKFPNPASRFALVGVAVALMSTGVRVAVTGAGARGGFPGLAMEAAVSKAFSPSALGAVQLYASG